MSRDELRADWYDIPWSTPITKYMADLSIWQKHKEEPLLHYAGAFKNPVHEHLLEACRSMFTPRQLRIHSWFEDCAEAYTNNDFIVYLGGGSTGKSHFVGLAALLDMVADKGNCYIAMVSTSKEMLLQRSMASSIEYLNCLQANRIPVPLKFIGQRCAIVPSTAADDLQNVKSMIRGIAIAEGTEVDARGAVLGVHLPRVRSVCDEIENMGGRANVFLSAQSNARMGAVSYKCCLMFNPQDLSAPGCVIATPDLDGGWAALDIDKDVKWKTRGGAQVVRFDGHKSPGLADTTLTFLPTKESIADVLKRCGGNTQHRDYYAMVRGFPVLSASAGTILSNSELIFHKATEDCQWRGDKAPMVIGGFDPAFTAEGDDAVLQLADLGYCTEGRLVMRFRERLVLQVDSSSKIPVAYQLVGQLKDAIQATGLQIGNLAIDDSGTQSVCDVVAKEIGTGFLRVNFGTKASDLPVSLANATPANKVFGNTASELWGVFAEYVRFGHCRKLSTKAAEEFTTRQFDLKRNPKIMETKRAYKKRMSRRSPDDADACALCGAVLRFVLGVRPGASLLEPRGAIITAPTVDLGRLKALNNLKTSYGV